MPTIKIRDIKIYYKREGAGTPLLFISGLGGDHQVWAPVVERLKHRYECIRFDNRGIGQSSRPRNGYTVSNQTQDVLGLLDALSVSQAHIVGQSMGGMIAQNIALLRPRLVRSLVLLASSAAMDSRTNYSISSRIIMQKRMTRYEYFRAIVPWFFGPETLSKPGFVENWAKKAASNPSRQSINAFSQLAGGIAEFDGRAQLKNIRQPTLVMVGEQDILTPPYMSRALAEGIPGAELVVFPGRGHMCVLEDTKAVIERIASFLERVDAS